MAMFLTNGCCPTPLGRFQKIRIFDIATPGKRIQEYVSDNGQLVRPRNLEVPVNVNVKRASKACLFNILLQYSRTSRASHHFKNAILYVRQHYIWLCVSDKPKNKVYVGGTKCKWRVIE